MRFVVFRVILLHLRYLLLARVLFKVFNTSHVLLQRIKVHVICFGCWLS